MPSKPADASVRRRPGRPRTIGETPSRRRLLDAAREVFSERGYPGATTAEIADRAGVSEPMIFRNFGSKAGLFSEVALSPVNDFRQTWRELTATQDVEPWPIDVLAREWFSRFYDLLHDNRGLIISYIAVSVFEPGVVQLDQSAPFGDMIRELEEWATKSAESRHLRGFDWAFAARAIIGMVFYIALFEDPRGPDKARLGDRDKIVDKALQLVLPAMTPAETPAPSPKQRASRAKKAATSLPKR